MEFIPFKKMGKLETLALFSCNIADIRFVGGLTNLRSLLLGSNKIHDLKPLQGLINLESLDVHDNQIRDIGEIEGLEKMLNLNLSENLIEDIRPILHLVKKGIPVIMDLDESDNINLYENPLRYPPGYIVEDGNEAIISYFENDFTDSLDD